MFNNVFLILNAKKNKPFFCPLNHKEIEIEHNEEDEKSKPKL